jgi:hypothetical protein
MSGNVCVVLLEEEGDGLALDVFGRRNQHLDIALHLIAQQIGDRCSNEPRSEDALAGRV